MTHTKGVVLLTTLSIILILSLIYSTFLIKSYSFNASLKDAIESIDSKIYLKSATHYLETLLLFDDTREVNYNTDLWIKYLQRTELNLPEGYFKPKNCSIIVQIIPYDSKFPLGSVVPFTTVQLDRAEMLINLFRELGFDQDGQIWTDQMGRRFFLDACQTVASLVDFMDIDTVSVDLGECRGMESEYGYSLFGNFKPLDFNQLTLVPGFTIDRVSRIMPFTTVQSIRTYLDLNTVSDLVLKALVPQLKPNQILSIIDFRSSLDGPFTQFSRDQQLQSLLSDQLVIDSIKNKTSTESKTFEIYGSYRCGMTSYKSRAIIDLARLGDRNRINDYNSSLLFTN